KNKNKLFLLTARAKHNIINTYIEGVATLDKIVRKRPKLQKITSAPGKSKAFFFVFLQAQKNGG
ncbi:hypothetical protein, partial [Streptococcus pluranimalium]